MHKIELICYAGSLACLKAALNSGADTLVVTMTCPVSNSSS